MLGSHVALASPKTQGSEEKQTSLQQSVDNVSSCLETMEGS